MVDNNSSERHHTVTFDLQNVTSEPQRSKSAAKEKISSGDSANATRIERICKILAIFIVIIAVASHLVRVLNSGKGSIDNRCTSLRHDMSCI